MKSSYSHFLEGEAVVDEVIHPGRAGRVYFQGTWWRARCDQALTLNPGDLVYVTGSNNITLLVRPSLQEVAS